MINILSCTIAAVNDEALCEAERLFLRAEYRKCISACRNLPAGPLRFLLLARARYRLKDFASSLDALSAVESLSENTDERLIAIALRAAVLIALGQERDARHAVWTIDREYTARSSPQAQCDVAYARSLIDWSSGRYAQAATMLKAVRYDECPQAYARAKILESWIAASQEQYGKQARLLIQALDVLRTSTHRDVGLIANALHALAAVCREVYVPCGTETALEVFREMEWTEDLQFEHFQTLRCLAWSHALRGNYIAAIRQLNAARDIAPSAHWSVLSRLDHALVARIGGQHLFSEAELLDAGTLAEALDWEAVHGEEIAALINAAELFADVDAARARRFAALFASPRTNIPTTSGFRHNGRLSAMEAYALACIAQANRNTNEVRRLAKSAYDAFDGMRFEWRAARAALLLYKAGLGCEWLTRAHEVGSRYPRSFVADEVAREQRADGDAYLGKLTPRAREIFALLCRGQSTDEIAEVLRCAPGTIRIHIANIHRAFEVSTRSQLLVKARELGLL
jgi:DNA-binding CsgD family transcriptional regulator/tetratricopeptide (TPR) repeat protein